MLPDSNYRSVKYAIIIALEQIGKTDGF